MTTFVFDAYGTLFDVHSVASATEEAFPGHGDAITQVWRMKQLEYTWLRSLMGRYEDFWQVTRESLDYTLSTLGLEASPEQFATVLDAYLHLSPYPEAREALQALRRDGHRLAILSNGSQAMLDALVRNTDFDGLLDAVISVDDKRIFKPSPESYSLVETRLGVQPDDVVFVSCNPFDVSGATAFGFKVAWIERVPETMLALELRSADVIGPGTMFKVMRMRPDTFGLDPVVRIHALTELAGLDLAAAGSCDATRPAGQ